MLNLCLFLSIKVQLKALKMHFKPPYHNYFPTIITFILTTVIIIPIHLKSHSKEYQIFTRIFHLKSQVYTIFVHCYPLSSFLSFVPLSHKHFIFILYIHIFFVNCLTQSQVVIMSLSCCVRVKSHFVIKDTKNFYSTLKKKERESIHCCW